MINPQPVRSNQSPYSKAGEKESGRLPSAMTPAKPRRRWWVGLLWTLIVIVVAAGTFGYAEYRSAASKIVVAGEGNSNDLLSYSAASANEDWSKFQQPGDGRFNVLVLGIGGINDEGQAHDGTYLTDSIQLVSLDTVNKKVSMTSVPRDFYYDIPGYGPNKINAVYSYAMLDDPSTAGQAARAAIGKVLGVNISNFVTIDFTAAQQAVDDVGGVDIDVPYAIYDPTYPCADQIHYCPFSISAGEHHLDGATALEYMRTRHDDSDFARSARQQAVLEAVKQKALTLGVISNPVKINDLIQDFSSHVKTDMQPSEVESFLSIYNGVSSANTTSNVLSTDATEGLLTAADLAQVGDVEYPTLGYSDYTAIHEWFAKNNQDPFIGKEGATISVADSPRATAAQDSAFLTMLQDYGFNATQADLPAGAATPSSTTVYSHDSSSKPVTSNYLKSVTGGSLLTGDPLDSGSDFEIIYVPAKTSVK